CSAARGCASSSNPTESTFVAEPSPDPNVPVTFPGFNRFMKADLHVHTWHSGMCTVPLLNRVSRESYTNPLELYETLKRRGMDLVTVTDHDSIDAVETLRRYDDFFLSEEVTCTLPSGSGLHVGVYDIQENHHTELQRRRDDFYSFVAYVSEQRLPATV